MKMFKKLVAVALAAVMALTMLTACGGSGSSTTVDPEVQAVLAGLNKRRVELGVGKVQLNSDMNAFAKEVAQARLSYIDGKIKEAEFYNTLSKCMQKAKALNLGDGKTRCGALYAGSLKTDFSNTSSSSSVVGSDAKYEGIAVVHDGTKVVTVVLVRY